ncbi:MAG: hypothetical protein EAX86_07395 [Candidatus Heimdallarchaeota archaeon]|nr:hypothetical protein [Candidatus Heimdallarchaeota archaeon]
MYDSRPTAVDRHRLFYLTATIDYLKVNGHRIAHHSLSRTSTPLSSRNDINPLLELINGEIADILTLDPESRKTFIKCMQYEELVAHFSGDMALNSSLQKLTEKIPEFHFIFATNGILTPSLLMNDFLGRYTGLSEITFLEVRFDTEAVHKIGNPNIYLRKVVGQVREVSRDFSESSQGACDCGGKLMQGQYQIKYWDKVKVINYLVCSNCGIQHEDPKSAGEIMTFMQGLEAQ